MILAGDLAIWGLIPVRSEITLNVSPHVSNGQILEEAMKYGGGGTMMIASY